MDYRVTVATVRRCHVSVADVVEMTVAGRLYTFRPVGDPSCRVEMRGAMQALCFLRGVAVGADSQSPTPLTETDDEYLVRLGICEQD